MRLQFHPPSREGTLPMTTLIPHSLLLSAPTKHAKRRHGPKTDHKQWALFSLART